MANITMSDDENIVDFTNAKQRADWQAKEEKAQALKQRFRRAMGWKKAPTKNKPGPGSKGPTPGGKRKK